MKGVLLKIFVVCILFFTSVQLVYCQTCVVVSDQRGEMENTEINRSYYGAQYDMIMQEESEMNPFAFSASPLGHALRLSARLLGELYAAQDDQLIKDEILHEMDTFCDRALDLSTLCDVALSYVKKQIAVMPEKQNYFYEEVHHFRQKIIMLSQQFSRLIDGQELSPEIITACVVFDRIVKKTGQMLTL